MDCIVSVCTHCSQVEIFRIHNWGKKGERRVKQRTSGQNVEALGTKRSNHLLLKECCPRRISGDSGQHQFILWY